MDTAPTHERLNLPAKNTLKQVTVIKSGGGIDPVGK